MKKMNAMEDFSRDINFSSGINENGAIVLTGTMRDRWHHIELQAVVDADSLEITACKVWFHRKPSPYCTRAEKQLQHLVGVVVGKGIMRHIRQATSGGRGCSNLRTLLTGLLPLALNIKASAGFSDEQEVLDIIQRKLTGTCAGYPVDAQCPEAADR